MFLSRNLRKAGKRVGTQELLAHTRAALGARVAADLADSLAAEQGGQAHVATRADPVLARAANRALGRVALEHRADVAGALHWQHTHTLDAGGVLATGSTGVLALLADQLGTDRAGNHGRVLHVLDVHRGARRVAVVLGLGRVLDTLVRLDNVLALGRLHDDATLHVHEIGGLGGARRDLAALTADACTVSALNRPVHLFVIFNEINLQLADGPGQQSQTTGATGLAGVGALAAHQDLHRGQADRAESHRLGARVTPALLHDLHASQAHGAAWGHHAGTLGAGEQGRQHTSLDASAHTALLVLVAADLADHLGADGGGNAGLRVQQAALGATRALHEASLGVVHGRALGGLGEVLALSRHVDDATLGVQELGGSLGGGGATTSHSCTIKQ